MAVVLGLVLLAYAADQLVLGSARVALIRRVSPLLVGVVIVGFGTSCPELLVSVIATAGGDPEIAVGNIVGSNIANLSLLLGIGALIIPITVASGTVRREVSTTVAATVLFAVVVQGGLARWEGGVLLVAMAGALWWVNLGARRPVVDPLGIEAGELAEPARHRLSVEAVRVLLGLTGTIAGAQLLLWGAVGVADRVGLGEGFIGATLVAIGTSLPELVTVVQSARRGVTDLIVGNLLGSNLFNALGVGGVVGLVGTGVIDDRSITVVAAGGAVAVAVLGAVAMRTSHRVDRWEGAVLTVVYAAIVPVLA